MRNREHRTHSPRRSFGCLANASCGFVFRGPFEFPVTSLSPPRFTEGDLANLGERPTALKTLTTCCRPLQRNRPTQQKAQVTTSPLGLGFMWKSRGFRVLICFEDVRTGFCFKTGTWKVACVCHAAGPGVHPGVQASGWCLYRVELMQRLLTFVRVGFLGNPCCLILLPAALAHSIMYVTLCRWPHTFLKAKTHSHWHA